ncbi:MAG: SCO family protein, partial [Aquabacterium sp.]|nr:SCO family protein [Aquabacterium sp.]
ASSPRHQGLYQHGEPPLSNLGGPLDLTRQTGQSFSLQDIRGSVALVFFGFTQCSNTCPVAMAQAQQLLAGFRSRKPPAVLFVTLDPLSDTPAALAQYLSAFDPRIIGLTGTPRQIEQAAKRYGVASQSASGTLEHSSRWYLLDDNMRVARVYKINTPVSAMAQDIVRAQTARAAATWSEGAP